MDFGSFDINGNVYQLVKLGLFGIAQSEFVHPESGNRGVQFCAMGGTEHLYRNEHYVEGYWSSAVCQGKTTTQARSFDLRHFWIPERHRIRSTRQSTTDAGCEMLMSVQL